jgi:hypothetical protein
MAATDKKRSWAVLRHASAANPVDNPVVRDSMTYHRNTLLEQVFDENEL